MAKSEIIDGLRIAYNGRSFPVWKYDEVPAEMRPATPRDLWYGSALPASVGCGCREILHRHREIFDHLRVARVHEYRRAGLRERLTGKSLTM